ncbi:hypothetical protein [Zooshikella ganghwensis]|uniref:Uncharacterized protein n=1 Tax=Zooshikella ganghwensis TaxID=202772 RepID=A0A4V1IMX2_9GAMM|nr:hypothetical protein [Zooshikella ganghwensis]RDH41721.1 hypothetical protein B9G39_27055 [Zooshikella ganghwensis]
MTEQQKIKIPRATDKSLISCFKILTENFDSSKIGIVAQGFVEISSVDLSKEVTDSLELILQENSTIIEHITYKIPGFLISFHRGGSQTNEKSGIFDEIILSINRNTTTSIEDKTKIKVVATINKKLNAFDPKRSVTGLFEEQASFNAIHTSNIERLEALNEQLVRKTHEYRLKLDEEHDERRTKLESSIENKKALLEKEFATKESILSEQVEELERKKKALDDSSNTHARREIRRDILKEIKFRQTKFSLTEGTNRLRRPIAYAMILLIFIFVVLAGISVIEFYDVLQGNDINKIIIAGIKQTLYSAGAIGSVIFFIRWMNRWFELHSQSEFELKHFELDMERASWLVETCLEWKDVKGTVIPSELLDSLSKNLFSHDKEKIDPLHHPADQLASALIGSASSVKLKAGDSSIEIDPKKLTKIKPNNAST